MAHVSVRQEVGAPVGAVWDLVGHLDNAATWAGVERCEIEGRGPGCVRTLELVGKDKMRERFDELDEAHHRYSAAVLEHTHLPLRDLHYTLSISEAGPERCAMEWEVDFEPDGVEEQRARALVEGFYTTLAVSVRVRLET